MAPLRFAPGWWKLIGERVCDKSCNPEEVFYPPSDEDTHFSDLDPTDVVHTTTNLVNDRLQMVADFFITYDLLGRKTRDSSPEPESEADFNEKQASKCIIANRIHRGINWIDLWKKADDRLAALVLRFAEEIIGGRLRHLIKLGYVPEDYSEIWEGVPSIIPDDRKFFRLTDEDFRIIHEKRINGSLKHQEPGGSPPELEQEPGGSPPELEQEPGSSAPKLEQEPGSSAPELEQESGSSAPGLEQEPGSSAPELEQEPGSSAPELEQESGSSAPELEQESGSSAPELEQESGSSAPELEQEPGSSAPKLEQEPCSSAPELEQEPGSSAPELDQEPGISAPELDQEPGSSAPELEQEPGSSAPELEQELKSSRLCERD